MCTPSPSRFVGHPGHSVPSQTAALIWGSLCGRPTRSGLGLKRSRQCLVWAGSSGTGLTPPGDSCDQEGTVGSQAGDTLPSSAYSEDPEGSVRLEEWGAGSRTEGRVCRGQAPLGSVAPLPSHPGPGQGAHSPPLPGAWALTTGCGRPPCCPALSAKPSKHVWI